MDNTSTTAANSLNTYFTSVLSDEIGLFSDDAYAVASAAFKEVPTLLGLHLHGVSNDYANHLLYQLQTHISEVVFILEDLISVVPNVEVESFISSLKDASKGKASQTFLSDFTRIMEAFLTEGGKVLHT